MNEIEIYLEGTSDRIFLANYLEVVLGYTLTISSAKNKKEKQRTYTFSKNQVQGTLHSVGFYTDFAAADGLFQKQLAYNKINGITTLVLVDADTPHNAGGFAVREKWLANVPNRADFKGFIMPNNGGDGYLETILKNIITSPYQSVIACMQDQTACLTSVQGQLPNNWELALPPDAAAEKQHMNYFKAVVKSKENYKNPDIWNLHDSYLTPLKTFLETHLK